MNKVILMGRLTADPEMRYTQSNKSVASFRLAVSRGGKPTEGQPEADFVNITAWEKTAEFVSKYFRKGQQVLVEGALRNNDYTDQQGVKHYAMQVNAYQVYFADSKRDAAPAQQEHVGPDGVGGQGYYHQAQNAPEPWEQQTAPQQAPPRQQPPQYQQAPLQPQQGAPQFGPPAGQQAAPPRQPWAK